MATAPEGSSESSIGLDGDSHADVMTTIKYFNRQRAHKNAAKPPPLYNGIDERMPQNNCLSFSFLCDFLRFVGKPLDKIITSRYHCS